MREFPRLIKEKFEKEVNQTKIVKKYTYLLFEITYICKEF